METKVKNRRGITSLLAVLAVASASLVATPAAASTSDEDREISGIETDLDISTESEMDAFLESDEPKTIHLDVSSGEVTKVEEGTDAPEFGTLTTVDRVCSAGDLCALAYQSPYSDFAFSGTGSVTGSWPQRSHVHTGNWYTRIQWENNAYTDTFGPSSTLIPSRTPATLTGVVISGVGGG